MLSLTVHFFPFFIFIKLYIKRGTTPDGTGSAMVVSLVQVLPEQSLKRQHD
jgi:hypothetical protein